MYKAETAEIGDKNNGKAVDAAIGLDHGEVISLKKQPRGNRQVKKGRAAKNIKARGEPITILAVINRFKSLSHESAVAEHAAEYVVEAFLGADGVKATQVIENGGAVEPARDEAVYQIRDRLLDMAKIAKDKAQTIRRISLTDLPQKAAFLLPQLLVDDQAGETASEIGRAVDRKLLVSK